MTNETTTEVNFRDMATKIVSGSAEHVVIDEMTKLFEGRSYYNSNYLVEQARHQDLKIAFRNYQSAVEDFIKRHVKEDEDATVEDLIQFAAHMDIELTKKVRITFNVAVEYQVEVPLGSEDDIDESDFDIHVDYDGDGEVNYDNFSIGDFDTEEVK